MFSRSPNSWKHVGILSIRDKGLKNGNHPEAQRTSNQHNNISINNEHQEEEASDVEEELQAPMVRIGVLSRSTSIATTTTTTTTTTSSNKNTQVESVEMVVPPSRVQSSRVSDSSIEIIRQSLREMEAQLVVAQNTVAAETRAEYDLHENTGTTGERQVFSPPPPTSKEEEEEGYDKENASPTDQDIKRVLDDLQWAEFVSFRSPKPKLARSRSQTGKAAICIKSMGRNCHPERQGRSWWRKHPIVTTTSESTNGQ